MNFCTRCGGKTDISVNFCNECGGRFDDNQNINVENISAKNSRKNFCDKCGGKNDGATFCDECGNRLESTEILIKSILVYTKAMTDKIDEEIDKIRISQNLMSTSVMNTSKKIAESISNLDKVNKTTALLIIGNFIMLLVSTSLFNFMKNFSYSEDIFKMSLINDLYFVPAVFFNTIKANLDFLKVTNNIKGSGLFLALVAIILILFHVAYDQIKKNLPTVTDISDEL